VLLALLVIVAGLVVLLSLRPWAGSREAADDAGPSSSPLPTLYPSTMPSASGAVPDCTADMVAVTAVTDSTSYSSDENPQLSLSLANISNSDCVINAGTSQQVFTITSGSDPIWSSTDCQTGASDLDVLLQSGRTVTGSPITWDRTRSSPDTCDGGREAVAGEGAAYALSVSIAGIPSGSTTQFLLR